MKWTSILAIYFIVWFLCLFIVLPFHARRAGDDAPAVLGSDPGAPAHVRPWQVIGQVSLIAAVVFGLYYANYVQGWIGTDDIELGGGPPRP